MKNDAPKISVIMSVYNTQQFLEESIESILNQTFTNFEFIIIDDKSNDNSKEIISNYMAKDCRIILIENETNLGIAAARNKGLEIARGKYIAIMDSDDISLPNRLEKEYIFLENNPEFFLVGSNAIKIDENGDYLEDINYCEDLNVIVDRSRIIHTSAMFRNKNIKYRDKFYLAEDCDLVLRILSSGLEIKNINETLVKFRIRPSGISLNNTTKGKLFTQKAVEFYNQRLGTGTDDYEIFDEKEILDTPLDDSRKRYLRSIIGFSLKNGDTDKAKKYFEEYKEMISLKKRILYKIVFMFPFIYKHRLKIKTYFHSL